MKLAKNERSKVKRNPDQKYIRYQVARYMPQPSYSGGYFLADSTVTLHQTLKEARQEIKYLKENYSGSAQFHIVDSYKGSAPSRLHPTDHGKPDQWDTVINCYQKKLFR